MNNKYLEFKNTLVGISIIALTFASILGVSAQDKPQYVVQTDLASGVYTYIDVDGPSEEGKVSGDFTALLPISEQGSRFELFAKGTPPDQKLYHLYEIPVGSYPAITIKTWSDDPYQAVTRTRADIPYQVEMVASNIDPESPNKSKRILYFEKVVAEYAPDENRIPIDGDANYTVVEKFYFNKNETLRAHMTDGDTSYSFSDINKLNFLKQNDPSYPYSFGDAGEISDLLPPVDAKGKRPYFKEKGEEYFRVYVWLGDELGWGKIAEKRVQVWPIAEGHISAIINEVRYDDVNDKTFSSIPTLEMNVSDLYPTSRTIMRIYKGEFKAGSVDGEKQLIEAIIANDYEPVNFDSIVPQSATQQITPDQWENDDLEDGRYTVEISTQTPLRSDVSEVLVYATFNLKRNFIIHGSITNAEAK